MHSALLIGRCKYKRCVKTPHFMLPLDSIFSSTACL